MSFNEGMTRNLTAEEISRYAELDEQPALLLAASRRVGDLASELECAEERCEEMEEHSDDLDSLHDDVEHQANHAEDLHHKLQAYIDANELPERATILAIRLELEQLVEELRGL